MQIIIIEKDTLLYDEFKFKCSIGKNGKTTKKIEGDNKTPKGLYALGPLYYRKDRHPKISTKLKKIEIMKIFDSELGEHPFPRSIKNIEALATFRGASVGVEFAESFQLIKLIDKITSGSIDPYELAFIDTYKLFPERWANIIDEKIKVDKNNSKKAGVLFFLEML